MKVITQLVQHFWQRGVLNADDAEYLVRSGFVRERDLEGFKLPLDEEPQLEPAARLSSTPVELRSLESVQESLVRRGRKRRGKGGSKRPTIEPKGLSARIQKELRRRADDLRELVVLCRPKFAPATWEEAAAHLRGLEPKACRSLLASHLKRGDVRLARLWNAVDMEAFHRLLKDDEAKGRTARAYLALLVVPNTASLGHYAWILRYDEIQAVNNLRSVHARLVEVLNQLYTDDRRTLTRCLKQSPGTGAVAAWALVLLHNANRLQMTAGSADSDFGPIVPPDHDVWKQAWTAALEMDRLPVEQLLVRCYGGSSEESPGPAGMPGLPDTPGGTAIPLYCPKGWHLPQSACSA